MHGEIYNQLSPEDKILTKISQSIVANGVALYFNEEIKRTPAYKKEIKLKGNLFIKQLEKYQKKELNQLLDASETETDIFFDTIYDLVNEISSFGVFNFQELTQIMQAYKKEPKALRGIVDKINKRNG